MVYDCLLILAVLFLASAVALMFNHGEAIESNLWFTIYLWLTLYTYYAWFWQKSGQTLGMRVWKIRLVSESGENPSWAVCYLRLLCALLSLLCLGLGYWWRLFTAICAQSIVQRSSHTTLPPTNHCGKD